VRNWVNTIGGIISSVCCGKMKHLMWFTCIFLH
jgi:hypothetical protein